MGPVQCHLPCLLASGSAKLDNSNYQSKFKTQLLYFILFYFILNESHTYLSILPCLLPMCQSSTMVRVHWWPSLVPVGRLNNRLTYHSVVVIGSPVVCITLSLNKYAVAKSGKCWVICYHSSKPIGSVISMSFGHNSLIKESLQLIPLSLLL